MAIAHICLDCGWDLARVRPRMEPYYGLSIVRCPRCDGASVRRVHPLLKGWKSLRRVDWAMTILVVQIILASAATAATVLAVVSLVAATGMVIADKAGSDIAWFFFVPLAVVAPLVGAWLTAGLGHHRRLIVWLLWIAWTTLVALVAVVSPFVVTGKFDFAEIGLGTASTAQVAIAAVAWFFALWMTGLLIFMTAAAVGIPLGMAFLWMAARARTQQWRWRRRMRRKALVAE